MSHHSPFQSLSPLSWSTDIAPLSPTSLDDLVTSTFTDAQLLIDSIPPLPKTTPSPAGRARSHTDSSVNPVLSVRAPSKKQHGHSEIAHKLSRDWKDVKTPQNQLGIAIYKINSGDGGGAWFARRSLHRLTPAESFEKWEMGLRREMGDTLEKKVGEGRGLGAEKWLGGRDEGLGRVDLYHVSARFPGPTTPRDFVTLMIMPKEEAGKGRAPRQLMIVSRPCDHPDSPPRPGFVRGTYQSVEVIREVPVDKPLRRVRSSIDLSRDEQNRAVSREHLSREAMLRAAERAVGHETESEGEGEGKAVSFRLSNEGDGSDTEMALEWLLITRSDPGGSVPKFMVEKGTPGGVVSDAAKFVKWLSSQNMEDLKKPQTFRDNEMAGQERQSSGELLVEQQPVEVLAPTTPAGEDQLTNGEPHYDEEELPPTSNSGVYGWLTSALGAATSAVANRVLGDAPLSIATDSEVSESDSDDDSEASFASAEDGTLPTATNTVETFSALDTASTHSTHSAFSEPVSRSLSREPTPSVSQAQSQHEKELNKLQDRMRKAQEKLERSQAQRRAKLGSNDNNGDGEAEKEEEKDSRALAKLREKHAHQVARQEEKYQRELQRLATKRAAEERKAAERRQKAARREERADLAMELDRVRAERDVASKEVEMLRERVGELQRQNTMLVARLGREGVDVGGLAK